MALRDDTARLFQLPLAEFISGRQKLAAELKRAGRAADAAVVKGLTKPARGAWAVNQVYWRARAAFDAVVVAGERLRAAQHARLGGNTEASVVSAVDARDRAIEAAVRAAEGQAGELGERLTPDLRQRVRLTFEAIAARPAAELPAAPGWLVEEMGPSGFGAMAALVPGGGLGAAARWDRVSVGGPGEAASPQPASRPALRLVEPPASVASARAAARRQAREAALSAARAEAGRAAEVAEVAQSAAEAAQRAVAAARAAFAAREQHLVEAQRAHEAARRELTRAEAEAATAAQVARQALTRRGAADLEVAERLDELASKPDR